MQVFYFEKAKRFFIEGHLVCGSEEIGIARDMYSAKKIEKKLAYKTHNDSICGKEFLS